MTGSPSAGNSTTETSSSRNEDTPTQQNEQSRPPYAFLVVVVALGLSALLFALVILRFSTAFEDPVMAISALSTFLGISGTVVGAYFAVTVTDNMARRTLEQANKIAEQAIANKPQDDVTTHQKDQDPRSSGEQPRAADTGKVSLH